MVDKVKVVPLAAESLGVRSMCTYIETSDVKILLDPGASLAPSRYGYPPHSKEYEAMARCRERIIKAAQKAEVVTLSHYHYDHYTPSYTDWCNHWSSERAADQIYEGKTILIKNQRAVINFNQRRRGWMFLKTGGNNAKKLETADGKVFNFGDTKLKFSDPVFHGSKNTGLGWVLMTVIEKDSDKVFFAPDIQGPMYNPTLKTILSEDPRLIVIGGPPIYLAGFRVSHENIQRGMENLKEVVRNVPLTIMEHHILREERWREMSQPIFDAASEQDHKVYTASEFINEENNLLESRRRELYEKDPPNTDFQKWMKMSYSKRKSMKPPIDL